MKKFIFNILTLGIFAISILLISCEDVVQVDIEDTDLDLITVEAYLNTKEHNNIFVKVEKSLPVDNAKENPPVNGATVEISDDQTIPNTVFLEEIGNSGIYLLPQNKSYITQTGRTYSLTITTAEGEVIKGEDYLQKVEQLDTVKVNLSSRGDFEYLAVFVSTQETPGPGHYYKWDVYINHKLLYGSDDLSFANDELVDGNYVYDLEIFTDWYDDEEESDDGNQESDKIMLPGDTIQVIQSSISRAVYDFYLGMQNQAFSGSPFSVPPANLSGNLTANDGKKVLGLFSARDISLGNSVIIDSTNFVPLKSSINF